MTAAQSHSHISRASRVMLLLTLVCTLVTGPIAPATALELDDEVIPGKPFTSGCSDTLNAAKPDVVHRVYLQAGQQVMFMMQGDPGTDFDLHLYGPTAIGFTDVVVASSATLGTSLELLAYDVLSTGWHYLRVRRQGTGNGACWIIGAASWAGAHLPVTATRLWGNDRYETAVAIAAMNFPFWENVDHVIIASGEDRAAADPLSASGLAWAYGAPVFLVRDNGAPASVITALQAIRTRNGPFHLHIVGGPASVTPRALQDIQSNVLNVIYDRVEPYNDRYTLAASVARRMVQERPLDQWYERLRGRGALIANGEDPNTFFDALALSPVCVTTGLPILLVRKNSIPGPTAQVLADLDLQHRTVGGGPATVSDAVFDQLNTGAIPCQRVWGPDRYATAAAISQWFADDYSPGATYPHNVGVAAKLPDALTGGSFLGLRHGCLLLTRPTSLPATSRDFLTAHTTLTGKAFVFGGPYSVEPDTVGDINDALDP